MDFRQVELFELTTGSRLTCWLPVDERLRPGVTLTLKGLKGREWVVLVVWKTVQRNDRITTCWMVGGFTGSMRPIIDLDRLGEV